MQNLRLAATIAPVLLGFCAAAETVSFEGLRAMDNFLILVPTHARLSNQLASVSGIVFGSEGGAGHVAVVQLGVGHATSGTNGIGGVNAGGVLSYTPIIAEFVVPSDPARAAVVDFFSVRCDSNSIAGTVTLEAFDQTGALLRRVNANDRPGATFSVTNSGIHSVRFRSDSRTVAFDDLTFSTPTPANQLRLAIHHTDAQVDVCWQSQTNRSYQLQFVSEPTPRDGRIGSGPVVGNGTTNCIAVVPISQVASIV
jgi:hypothetical protein